MRRRALVNALPAFACCCAIVLLAARVASACGPFFDYPVFTYETHPDFALTHFAGGELGVLQPGYAPTYLVVAYRYLSGVGLDAAGRQAVIDLWREDFNGHSREYETPQEKWLHTRLRVAGVAPAQPVVVFRRAENWYNYQNCLDDAFRNAARTLAERIDTFGADDTHVLAWVSAQDAVFANCSGGPSFPEPAGDDVPPLLRADRAYQIAAAHFYAGELDKAEELFRAIAADSSSPWHGLSAYLVARVLIRAKRLDAAEAQLQAVLADPSLAPLHGAARGMLGFVRFRLHPEDRALELAAAVVEPTIGSTFGQDLGDYTRLAALPSGDDLGMWLADFATSAPRAIETWQRKRSLPWLVAALSAIQVEDPRLDEVLAAAAAVPHDSPGYLHVAYHRFRLLAAAGRREEARQRLDALLSTDAATVPPSSLNLFLSLRAGLVRDLDEFLRFAQQIPVGIIGFDGESRMVPNNRVSWDESNGSWNEVYNVTWDLSARPPADFDDQAKATLELLPARSLMAAAEYHGLDAGLRGRIVRMAWTRAVLLDDDASAHALLPTLETTNPELTPVLDDYRGADDREERHFAGLLAILRAPSLSPVFNDREDTPLLEIDNFRRNWWCPAELRIVDDKAPLFLGAGDLQTARSEWAKLTTLGSGPNALSTEVLAWASNHRDDPRVPEALHLAVRSTRYGCTDSASGDFSRAAFRLLHRRYPKSEWTERTPYWFD